MNVEVIGIACCRTGLRGAHHQHVVFKDHPTWLPDPGEKVWRISNLGQTSMMIVTGRLRRRRCDMGMIHVVNAEVWKYYVIEAADPATVSNICRRLRSRIYGDLEDSVE